MKQVTLSILLLLNIPLIAQYRTASINKKASISEMIGITDVKIEFNRPAVNGREGKIWGTLVHYGFQDLQYGTSKAAPWRAGADENTTFECSTEVMIEDKILPAGKYGFFIAMAQDKAILIFSKRNTAWGSFWYKEDEDVLRVTVNTVPQSESVERLKYEFSDQTMNSAIVSLRWEKLKIPFKVSVNLVKEQIEEFRRAFTAGKFYSRWQNMDAAASYCLNNNVNLEEALFWADRAINSYFGEANFRTLSTQAGLFEKLGDKAKADSIMKKAMPMATIIQLYSYAARLLGQNKIKEAGECFRLNFKKAPEKFLTRYGMMEAFAAEGNFREALKYANSAMDKISETGDPAGTKIELEQAIANLKAGKAIN